METRKITSGKTFCSALWQFEYGLRADGEIIVSFLRCDDRVVII